MSPLHFVGRSAELSLLDSLWANPTATLLVVYGRRRIGKTRLLTHWIGRTGHRALYWVAEPTSARDQLRAFSQSLYNFANPDAPAPTDFAYATWAQAWQQVAVLAEQAPLYGRPTAQLKLAPLSFGSTGAYFPAYGAAERVAVYAMFGGVPAYWERLDARKSVLANIRGQLLGPGSPMHDEPRLLLYDFVKEPRNYVALLQAIAHGHHSQQTIAGYTGMDHGHVSKYLGVLREAGFVERRVPVTEREGSRRGRYHLTDPYLRFYYRFLAPRQAQLALGVVEPALAEIKRHLLDFIGMHTWEEICREWVLRSCAHGQLAAIPDQVGSIWTPALQIDVAGINTREKTLLLGECKWSPRPIGRRVLRELVAKVDAVVPKEGRWTVDLAGFARGGWTPEAAVLAAELNRAGMRGENWVLRRTELLDLAMVDGDLSEWSA
jgi:AAA+ ATPase superfamily predicted ATPase